MRWGAAVLGLLLLLASSVQAGKVYRWVDEDGNVHFGDRPAREDAAQAVPVRPAQVPTAAPESAAQRREKTDKLLRAWETERRIKAEQEAKVENERLERSKRCNKARNELRDIEAGWRFYELDEQGQRRYYSDEEHGANETFWREQVARYCD